MIFPDSHESNILFLYQKIDNKNLLWLSKSDKFYNIQKLLEGTVDLRKRNIIYSHIDKSKFLKKLTYIKFARGIFDEDVNNIKLEELALSIKIENMENEIRKLEKDKRDLLKFL